MRRNPGGNNATLGLCGTTESGDAGFQLLVLAGRDGVFRIGVFDLTKVD